MNCFVHLKQKISFNTCLSFFFFFLFQSYRDLKEVTPEALQMVKRNFEWVAERVEVFPGGIFLLMNNASGL